MSHRTPSHRAAIDAHGIPTIDLVVVNLYPFRETVAKPGCTIDEADFERLHEIGAVSLHCSRKAVSPGLVERLHAAGHRLLVWTVNDPADMRRLLAMGVGALPGDGMISDYPDRLVGLRKSPQ